MSHVLIVDDDSNTREALAALATQEGFTTAVAGCVAEARIQLVRQRPDVVLMDLRLPDGSGMDLFEDLEDRSSIETILITGHASVESAVDALRLGTVPLDDAAAVAGWPDDPRRAARVVEGLVADGLARRDGDVLSLP